MTKKSFLDTNVLIALLFLINSLHPKAEKVFNQYTEFFWSQFVKDEFDKRFYVKQRNLQMFFQDLEIELKNPKKELYSINDLKKFVEKNYTDKIMDDAKNSINSFWNEYNGIESQVHYLKMQENIGKCISDLTLETNNKKDKLEKLMQLTPPRTNKYPQLDRILKKNGVSTEDRHVTLDGHDFACYSTEKIDFITFDIDCYNGASDLTVLCFNSIKGKDDFTAS